VKPADLKEKAEKDKLTGQGKQVKTLIDHYEYLCEALSKIARLDYEWDFKQQRGMTAAGGIATSALSQYGPDKDLG
jgi:hypothetical protein